MGDGVPYRIIGTYACTIRARRPLSPFGRSRPKGPAAEQGTTCNIHTHIIIHNLILLSLSLSLLHTDCTRLRPGCQSILAQGKRKWKRQGTTGAGQIVWTGCLGFGRALAGLAWSLTDRRPRLLSGGPPLHFGRNPASPSPALQIGLDLRFRRNTTEVHTMESHARTAAVRTVPFI